MGADGNLWLTGSGKWDHKLRDPHPRHREFRRKSEKKKTSVQSPCLGSVDFFLLARPPTANPPAAVTAAKESRSYIHMRNLYRARQLSSSLSMLVFGLDCGCYIARRRAIICQIHTLLKPAGFAECGEFFFTPAQKALAHTPVILN